MLPSKGDINGKIFCKSSEKKQRYKEMSYNDFKVF